MSEDKIPIVSGKVAAGFPSPADDYLERNLDLNEFLIKHPVATFFVRVDGDSMLGAGIHHGDILIVDRALEPVDRKVVIAVVDGRLTVRRLRRTDGKVELLAENPDYQPISLSSEEELEIWGVVTTVIHPV